MAVIAAPIRANTDQKKKRDTAAALPRLHPGRCTLFQFGDYGLRDVAINGGYLHGRLRVKERMYLLLAIDARDAPKRSEQQRQVYENGGEDLM